MNEKEKYINQHKLVSDWLKYVIDYVRERLDDNGVSRARLNLYNSFLEKVLGSPSDDGTVQAVVIKFLKHLRYLDMGAGRSISAGSFRSGSANARAQKLKRKKIPVYNKPFTYQVKRLLELLMENFGLQAVQVLERSVFGDDGNKKTISATI